MRRPSKLLVIASLGVSAGACLRLERAARAADTNFYVSLHYEVDGSLDGCWDEAELRRNVAVLDGYDPFRADAPVSVSIHVGTSGRSLHGQIDWRNADGSGMGERQLVAADGDCVKLVKEMSFAVAFQIELLRAPPATPAKSPGMPPPPPVAVVQPAPASEAWPMWAGVGSSLAWGLSPALTGEVTLFVGARRRSLSLELGAQTSLPSTKQQWDSTGFRQTLAGGQASLCGHRGLLSACLLGRAGEVWVSGLGVDQPRSPAAFVAQAGLRLAATLKMGSRWSATAHADLLGLLTPYTVDLNHAGVWTMPRLAVLAGIDLSARFR